MNSLIEFNQISHTYLEGKAVLLFLDKITQKTAPFSGSVPPNFMTAGILNSSGRHRRIILRTDGTGFVSLSR